MENLDINMINKGMVISAGLAGNQAFDVCRDLRLRKI